MDVDVDERLPQNSLQNSENQWMTGDVQSNTVHKKTQANILNQNNEFCTCSSLFLNNSAKIDF